MLHICGKTHCTNTTTYSLWFCLLLKAAVSWEFAAGRQYSVCGYGLQDALQQTAEALLAGVCRQHHDTA